MNEMERNRSGSHSGGVVKNRSSAGCLIIKKKRAGDGGVGSSRVRKLHESEKAKKRPRLNAGDSLSSDEEVDFSSENNDFEDMREGGLKRSKLDVYDFDEYDDLSDVETIGTRHYHDRGIGGGERKFSSSRPGMKSGRGLDLESGSSKGDIIYKRRNSFNGNTSGEKIKSGDHYSGKRRLEVKSELPISMGTGKFGGSDEAIRLQGKNGVLKVRVKHKKEISEHLPQNYIQVEGNSVVPRSQELTSKSIVIRPSPNLEKKLSKKQMTIGRIDQNQQKKQKSFSPRSREESHEKSDDSDSSPELQTENVEVRRSVKRGRSGGSTRLFERVQPIKSKGAKVKRGSGTEKQLLREKIRNMLVNAGWRIDYRPRRGRDYFDAVYVNPMGTAYWSIIKAYDALQKQLAEEGKSIKAADDCCSFAPISEDILSKLTRQTQKKIEKELKRKKREELRGKRKKELTSGSFEENESDTESTDSGRHDEKLSSFIKRSGKSLKSASKDICRDVSGSNIKMQERGEKSSSISNFRFIHARKSKKIGRCTLLVRNSVKGLDSESDGFVPYTGKRNLLSWLIDSGTVKLSEKVHYMNRRRTRVVLEGWITKDGIHCACCSKIVAISKFEIHAASKLRQPFQNIYLSSGASLLQCQIDAWNKQDEPQRNGFNKIDVNGDDPNDDTCAICGDGGNLICCDSCPSTFHQNCLDIKMLPPGDWHCPHCSCKFCGLADVNIPEGNDTRPDTMLICRLCEGKYHCSCVEEIDGTSINSNSAFCGKTCQELFDRLQKLLGIKHELEAGLCWSLIHRTDLGSNSSPRGFPQRVEWNSKLAVALTVMDECFLPIIDRRSGINMIHSVLYNCGSNITRLNYSGFYTAILERGDEIISAASIRIRGTQFAEMPFIGTRHIFRRQGMFCRLLSAIESALRSLKVEKLIIPAISELMDTWTTVFGFGALQESDKQEMRTMNMLVFPGTDMLLKKLVDPDSANTGLAGVDSLEVGHSASVVPDLIKKSDIHSSDGPGTVAAVPDNQEMNGNSVTDFGSPDMVFIDENSRHSAPNICNEVQPSLPTASRRDSIEDKDETSLHSASASVCDVVKPNLLTVSPHDSNEDKPSLHVAFADLSTEIKTLVAGNGSQGITNSQLQFDIKLNVSAGDKDHISAETNAGVHDTRNSLDDSAAKHSSEGSQGTTSNKSRLDLKLNESVGDVEDHISADASMGIHEHGNSLDDSAAKHDMEVPEDCKLTRGAEEANADSGSPVADGMLVRASDNTLLNVLGNDDETHHDGILFSITKSATDGKVHSLSEASLDLVMEKPVIQSPAEDNMWHSPAENADVCSDSLSLRVSDNTGLDAANEAKIDVSKNNILFSQTTEQLTMPVDDSTCKSLQNASHGAVVIENPLPDSCDGISNQPILEGDVLHAHNINVEVANDQPL